MLQVKGIKKSFQNLAVLEGINLSVQAGEILALIGPSGCGKSTLLNIIAGLCRPDAGAVNKNSEAIGYIFQDDRLLPWRTVYDNIGLVRRKKDGDEIRRLLSIVELEDFATYYPAQLSGGMCKRCGIARAFYCQSNLLLLDEPFQALDVRLRTEMHDLLRKIWQEKQQAMLFVTHDIKEAIAVSHRVAVLSSRPGKILRELLVPRTEQGEPMPDVAEKLHLEIEELINAKAI